MPAAILEDLRARGLLVQSTDSAALDAHLCVPGRTLYCGFDPTADSLHIGNLVPLLVLKRFQMMGHRPILLLGGATGLIGDPSGKSAERSLNEADTVAGYVQRIRAQTERFLSFDGDNAAIVVNNLDWTQAQSVIEFLRDVGKHFSVNMMMQRESVRARLDRPEQGISYTEFSYMLLQASDFLQLYQRHDCTLQVGGNDQWGNIVSGVDLIRRKVHATAHALTLPLITRADGTKFGKTAGGSVWLDAARTSPYSFYQFWLNTADADVESYLKVFTLLAIPEIIELVAAATADPGARLAQQCLAETVTRLVHGDQALASALRISDALFSGSVEALSETDLESLRYDGMAASRSDTAEVGVLTLLTETGLVSSNGAARKLVQGNGLRINGVKVSDPRLMLDWSDALHQRFYLLRKGKKQWHLVYREA